MKLTEQLVSHGIAVELKDLGFDEECLYTVFLDKEGEIFNGHQMEWMKWNSYVPSTNPSLGNCFVAAPFWQQVIDWFRGKHKIHISLPNHYDGWSLDNRNFNNDSCFNSLPIIWYENFYEARKQAVISAIGSLKSYQKLKLV